MSRISELFDSLEPVNSESVKSNLVNILNKHSIPIGVDSVIVDIDGHIMVDFTDLEGDILRAIFTVDDDGYYCIIDSDDEEYLVLDLEPMRPVIRKTYAGAYVDLTDSSWITKSLLKAIFSAGTFDNPSESLSIYGGASRRIPILSKTKYSKLNFRQKEALAKSLVKRKNKPLKNSLNITSMENDDEN